MRLVPLIVLLAASPSTVSSGCTPRSERPDPLDIAKLELHSWSEGRKDTHYWVTEFEPGSGCVSTEALEDGIIHIVRDCSLPQLVRPRLAELISLFEHHDDQQQVGELIGEGGEGRGVVFERGDGTRWTVESKLLDLGGELLDRDAAEWLMIGPPPSPLPPTPEGWTQLLLKDRNGTLERRLESDGRWSCESWLVSDKSLQHQIIIRRGRVEPERAAKLLDGYADGVDEGEAATSEWTATLQRVEPSATIELHSDALVSHWNEFADEFDDDCRLE